jgi:hypothetical protein
MLYHDGASLLYGLNFDDFAMFAVSKFRRHIELQIVVF